MKEQWFESWFDSPYYHLLYANRDYKEAEDFILNLLSFLKPEVNAHVLDLGCGKGRHSLFLSNNDLVVTGLDLSKNSIDSLEEHKTDRLHFEQWDMRHPYKSGHFDYVFNLFTSFGYFGCDQENLNVLLAVNHNLKDNGILVLDFLNETVVRKTINQTEIIERGNIKFRISKIEKEGSIVKNIIFDDHETHHEYEERVQLISRDKFMSMFELSGFEVLNIFGDYDLQPFDENNSSRMIFIVQKSG